MARTLLSRAIRVCVGLSVFLGAALLVQAFPLLPLRVALSLLVGWLAYIVAAVLVFRRHRVGYPMVLVLAVLTLAVSLPQPEHYSLLNLSQLAAGATFVLGSAVQILLVVLITVHMIRGRSAGIRLP